LTDLIYCTAVLIYCLFIFSNFQCVFVMFFGVVPPGWKL